MAPKKSLDFERPLTTVDIVIFTVVADALHVLLSRRPDEPAEPFPGRRALPGGFVDVARDASLHACALRKLREKTGVSAPYLEQLGSWGSATRDPRGWSATHAWFAMVCETQDQVAGSAEHEWVKADIACRRKLAFDHAEILVAALTRLRAKVEYTSLPAFLLAEPFTLPQLQRMYEIVLDRPLDKSAFRKRMLDAAFLEEAGGITGTSGREAMGYRLRNRSQATVFPRTFRSGE
ncbi:MAG: NUDIX hydrolase [Ramlibacter sp.]|nr:NUDIX hydrolase [Ramlibacter sp.]